MVVKRREREEEEQGGGQAGGELVKAGGGRGEEVMESWGNGSLFTHQRVFQTSPVVTSGQKEFPP